MWGASANALPRWQKTPMIEVFSYRNGGKCRLYVQGHAAYHPGNDIVCAGVSALVGALAQYAKGHYRHVRCHTKAGNAFLAAGDGAGDGFDMIVQGLAAIARSYPDHVRVHVTVTN